jgi:hypothetical protein
VATFGLACTPVVKWLIVTEPRLQDAIQAFAADAGPDAIDVLGEPSKEELKRFRENKDEGIALPKVTILLRKVRHSATKEPAVEATCSPEDMETIQGWIRKELTKRRMAALAQPGGDAFLRTN